MLGEGSVTTGGLLLRARGGTGGSSPPGLSSSRLTQLGFLVFIGVKILGRKTYFAWSEDKAKFQPRYSKKIVNVPIVCILQKKRNSPVIIINTIYETIILKRFKNSIIIQSAKQLVFYDGTDFIVAGYGVKHLQHILDLNKPKTQALF